MAALWMDLRFAVRNLRKGRLVTALVVLSLALAIAGNATVFGLVRAIVFQPLPYPDPEQITFLGERDKDQPRSALASLANLMDWRERNRSFTDLAGFRVAHMSLGGWARREPLVAAQVTSGFFELLGARTFRGRLFGNEEYREGLSVAWMRTMDEWLDLVFGPERYVRDFLTGFGFLALLLAALGTYGVLAHTVAQRSHEIGVRMALGADAPRILRMVVKQGAILGITGLVLGAPGVIAVTRALDGVLTYAPPADLPTVAAVFVVLFMSTGFGEVSPRRAARVDPRQ